MIESDAFRVCVNLSKAELETEIETIRNFAFASCYSLTEIILPKSVDILEFMEIKVKLLSGVLGITLSLALVVVVYRKRKRG